MKWEDYYDRFWDWAESTQISRISTLTDFTSSSEVAEIANEFFDEKNSTRLVKRAMQNGIRFTPAEIIELGGCLTEEVFNEAIRSCRGSSPRSSTRNWKVSALMRICLKRWPRLAVSAARSMTRPLNRRSSLHSRREKDRDFSPLCSALPRMRTPGAPIRDAAQETVPIVPRIMDIAMAAGTMGIITHMAVNSAAMIATESHNIHNEH